MTNQWIQDFIRTHQRPPRILHVGNIANNAYQNAKMLNAAGADCDVLCADYYHIMGSPEWDDATITGDVGNPDFPTWHKVDLHGFQRPSWFIQAPRRIAIAYLCAKRQGDTKTAQKLWATSQKIMRYYSFREGTRLRKPLLFLEKAAFKALALVRSLRAPKPSPAKGDDCPAPSFSDPLLDRLNADAAALFPQRNIHFNPGWDSDYTPDQAALYAPLFQLYDVVQGYATDCIWPYLTGFQNYTAFEHGTLRYLTFEDHPTAHLMLLAYARARAITVTNLDCYDNAKYIAGPAHTPIICGLHGIDMARIMRQLDAAKPAADTVSRFGVPEGVPVFFCPARHTWDEQLGVFLKQEDKAIRAAARLAKEGARFKLVLASWGSDVDRIKTLIAGLPALQEVVQWTPPLAKADFYRSFLSVEAVVDQFFWKAYGGIDFEVLCASHAVLISSRPVKDAYALEFFGRLLPYYGCDEEDEIYTAMKAVIERPCEARALARQGRDWILECHSDQRIVDKNCQAFAHCQWQSL